MFATMYAAEGVGLAATQVGVDLAVFVFDCPDDDDVRHVGVFCNPVVTLPEGKDRKLDVADEGCLSLPGAYGELARPDHAICRGQDAYGEPIEVVGTGLLARCLQHETDHLNGTVFGDRLAGRARKKLYQARRRRYADWPVCARGLARQPAPTAQRVAGDGRRGGHVERVDSGVHRDLDANVGGVAPALRQPGALGAEQDGQPVVGAQSCGYAGQVDRVVGQGQGDDGETGGPQLVRAPDQSGSRAHGRLNTAPMLTLIARR